MLRRILILVSLLAPCGVAAQDRVNGGIVIEAVEAKLAVPQVEEPPQEADSAAADTEEADEEDEPGVNGVDKSQLKRKLRFVMREVKRLGDLDDATYDKLLELGDGVIISVLKDTPTLSRFGQAPPRAVKPVFHHEDWKQGYAELVPEETRALIGARMKERIKGQRDALGRYLVVALDSKLLLSAEQREAVSQLVMECAQKPSSVTTHDLLTEIVSHKHELDEVLSEVQLKMLSAPVTHPHNYWQRGVSLESIVGGEKMGFIEGVSEGLAPEDSGPPAASSSMRRRGNLKPLRPALRLRAVEGNRANDAVAAEANDAMQAAKLAAAKAAAMKAAKAAQAEPPPVEPVKDAPPTGAEPSSDKKDPKPKEPRIGATGGSGPKSQQGRWV